MDGLGSYRIIFTLHHSKRFLLYKAERISDGKMVLIKTQDPSQLRDISLGESIVKEAEAAFKLSHPNIRKGIQCFTEGVSNYLVADFAEGMGLAEYLLQHPKGIPLDKVLDIGLALAKAIRHANKNGEIHQNLNPYNIIIDPKDQIKVIGFGKDRPAWQHSEGNFKYALPILYTAPEVYRGTLLHDNSDLYSWAVLMYQMLCGSLPWKVDSFMSPDEQKEQCLTRAVIMPDSDKVPTWLYGILLSCLKLDPKERIENAGYLISALISEGEILFEEAPEDEEEVVSEPIEEGVLEPEHESRNGKRLVRHRLFGKVNGTFTVPDYQVKRNAKRLVWRRLFSKVNGTFTVPVPDFHEKVNGTFTVPVPDFHEKVNETFTVPLPDSNINDIVYPELAMGFITTDELSTTDFDPAAIDAEIGLASQAEDEVTTPIFEENTHAIELELDSSIDDTIQEKSETQESIPEDESVKPQVFHSLDDEPIRKEVHQLLPEENIPIVSDIDEPVLPIEPLKKVSSVAELSPQAKAQEPLPSIPMAERELTQKIVTPDAPKPIKKETSPPPRPKEQISEPKDLSGMQKSFRVLMWLSLFIIGFILVKTYVINPRQTLKLSPEEEEPIEAVAENLAENIAIAMIKVPADTLIMGSISPEADDDEFPLLTVFVPSFYISPTEITQAQWRMVYPNSPSQFTGDDLPVENVSFYDVVEYCNAKSLKDGFKPVYDYYGSEIVCDFEADGYRLPTEAEWELAAKSGKGKNYSHFSGSDVASEVAWVNANSGARTNAVASKKSNDLGIFDMGGNVYEWVWNWYAPYTFRIPNLLIGPDNGTDKVIRGGSWYHPETDSRISNRDYAKPYTKKGYIGFRVVRRVSD